MTSSTHPFMPQVDHLLGESSWLDMLDKVQGISSARIAGRGECNNDTHLDIGDPKSGVSPTWIFNMCNFQLWFELTCFQANLLEGCCFHFACLLLYVF